MSIRNHINAVEEAQSADTSKKALFEMPMLHTKPMDFGLTAPAHNRHEYERLADSDYKVIEETPTHLLAHTFDREENRWEIFGLNYKEKALVYYVEFVPHVVPQIGPCATQVILWRRAGGGMAGVTTKVFDDFLGKNFAGVVSDEVQTYDGRRFWVDRMAEAAHQGKTVGLIDNGRVSSIYDPSTDYQSWLTETNAWSEDETSKALRYFISKNPPKA